MPPPRASFAETRGSSADSPAFTTPEAIAAAIEEFLAEHAEAVVLEGGKVAFDLREARADVRTEHGRCTLHLWSERSSLVRTVLSATPRASSLRLATIGLGQTQSRLLELTTTRARRTPDSREKRRQQFVALIERVLARSFDGWTPESFRTAMDLERSFGPAYARGMLARGKETWAVIAVNDDESLPTVDAMLTFGILWLEHVRNSGDGRRNIVGLRVIVPRGRTLVTQSRMRWLNAKAARWELFDLDEASEELHALDLADTGNIRTRLVHLPDEEMARERFDEAIAKVMALVPAEEQPRVDQRLRSPVELSFQLHGLEFARARLKPVPGSFAHSVELTVGAGAEETELTEHNRAQLAERVRELFDRRRAITLGDLRERKSMQRQIGERAHLAHARLAANRTRMPRANNGNDPLYRAAPERWLESVLRRDLAPLTRGLAQSAKSSSARRRPFDANDDDDFGNRIEDAPPAFARSTEASLIPRLDPRFVYAQVSAVAAASDRGLLDLLGLTTDGRLAVIELKASEDPQLAMQGLDYWLRIRAHHLASVNTASAVGELQRHGYFTDAVLSPLPPRLYLVAPALRIHPATEIVLRYVSPEVEWQLIALDERWREQVRVVWRRTSKSAAFSR